MTRHAWHSLFMLTLVAALCSHGSLQAAPTRAIYFTENFDIKRMNPDGSGKITLFSNAISSDGEKFEVLRVDSPNGHLYWSDALGTTLRGNLDGTGAVQIHRLRHNDFVVDPAGEKIYYAVRRYGIVELDLVTNEIANIYLAGGNDLLQFPNLHFDAETATVYWTDHLGFLSTPNLEIGVPDVVPLPVLTRFGGNTTQVTQLEFDSGTPVPYSISSKDNLLFVGGLDGDAAIEHQLEDVETGIYLKFGVDTDGGHLYHRGWISVEGTTQFGIYRTNLSGGDPIVLAEADRFGAIAIDTSDLDDSTVPVVTISSPAVGPTGSQAIPLVGSASDDSILTGATWSHNGIDQGGIELSNGQFNIPSINLLAGDNLLEVFATDLAGNIGVASVTASWEPPRSLAIRNPPSVREGQRVEAQVLLDSPGGVAGMTFTLHYDPALFEAPHIEAGGAISGSSPNLDALTPGEVNVTFVDLNSPVPAGEHEIITASLRARSVPTSLPTELTLTLEDMADGAGDSIVSGTTIGPSGIEVEARSFIGDINSTGHLDVGDATRMQAMLAGNSEIRAWDGDVNDLNHSSQLDLGDVIRVMRTVVGIDPQPSSPAARPESGSARIVLSADHAAAGEEITLSVKLEDINGPLSGASFTLDYPSEFLHLENESSHTPGTVVAGGAITVWNITPAMNDYSIQDGMIRFGASSPVDWPASAEGGEIAEFRFTVTSVPSEQPIWPISILDVEVSTDSGFNVVPVRGETVAWISSTHSFALWREENFSPAELADPEASGVDGDWDRDGFNNAAEYFAATDPKNSASKPASSLELIHAGDGVRYLAFTYQRAFRVIDASATLQTSTDLINWRDAGDTASTERVIDPNLGIETITVQQALANSTARQYARLKIILAD